jgi:LasA protease
MSGLIMARQKLRLLIIVMLALNMVILPACSSDTGSQDIFVPTKTSIFLNPTEIYIETQAATPLPTRERYSPGELVDYTAQTGDTLPALAAHFHCKVEEIREANPILPKDVTTLPEGLPMKMPIYYQSLWGSPFQIIPDSLFINGPAQLGFDVVSFVDSQPGWLKDYIDYPAGNPMRGGEIIQHVADNFSISPRLLLAIVEYQTNALSQNVMPSGDNLTYTLNFVDKTHKGLSQQLVLAANLLNNGYYGWRTGRMTSFDHADGRMESPDPWQNAASVAIQYYFAQIYSSAAYQKATQSMGMLSTYKKLFGDPWQNQQAHIPGSLQQPDLLFPFEPGKAWNFTGGPHTGWGTGDPWAAVDFAPSGVMGCSNSYAWVTAVAAGVIVRVDTGSALLDLDGDGDEQTGWTIFYLHLAPTDKVRLGQHLEARDPMGHPSCEGGTATGTHIHIARKYNGEWIAADSALPLDLEGWTAKNGSAPYQGKLERFGNVVIASPNADVGSQIISQLQ